MKTPQVIVILILLVVCGCGSGSKVNRLPIQGLIVIEGRRIDHGSITFLPSKGTSGPSANTSVSDGQYQFTTTNRSHRWHARCFDYLRSAGPKVRENG